MRMRLEILLALWWVFVAVGVVEVIGSIAAERYESNRQKYGPVLRHPDAIAVSRAGGVFVYVNEWQSSEIRAFEADGRWARSWPVETLQGGASIGFDSDERLEVFAFRGNRLFLFDTNGRLLASRSLSPSETAKRLAALDLTRRATGPEGDSYAIQGSEIVRLSPTGNSTVVVPGPPAYLSFFIKFPFGPGVFLIHGAIVIVFGLVLAFFRRWRAAEAVA